MRSLNRIYERDRKSSARYRNTHMITEFKDQQFVSSLLRIPINQLPLPELAQAVPASPAVWFAVDDANNVWYIGQAENLRDSLSSRHPKIKAFKENGVSSMAYWVVEKKELKNITKKIKEFFKPPLNQNKSEIFVPAINSLVKNTGLAKKEIIIKSDIGENFLNNLEKNNRGIFTSKLENILLSDCVTQEIFKEFLIEIIRLWKLYKEYPNDDNDEQQPTIDDDTTLEEAVLAALDDSEKKNDEIKELDSIREQLDSDGCFTPEDCEDARKKIKTYIACRQGQPKFRRLLIQAYNGQCAITGFDFEHALEAAHIHPYKGDDTNNVWNGLLLRGDIHTLFDLYLITVHPKTKEVRIAPELKNTKYKELDGKKLNLPKDTGLHPSDKILKWHYKQCKWITNE